jgi:hypothetical protein
MLARFSKGPDYRVNSEKELANCFNWWLEKNKNERCFRINNRLVASLVIDRKFLSLTPELPPTTKYMVRLFWEDSRDWYTLFFDDELQPVGPTHKSFRLEVDRPRFELLGEDGRSYGSFTSVETAVRAWEGVLGTT